jgi:hypothetical protein
MAVVSTSFSFSQQKEYSLPLTVSTPFDCTSERKWNGYKVIVLPEEHERLRWIPILGRLIPYFWDTDIVFDLIVRLSTNKTVDQVNYTWELRSLGEQEPPVRNGSGVYHFEHRFRLFAHRNHIELGSLKPHTQYRFIITLSDANNLVSKTLQPSVSFTIKDRDELYLQLLVALVAVGIGLLARYTK